MARIILTMVVCLLLEACGPPAAMYLSPKMPATAETIGMKVHDSRIPIELPTTPARKYGEVISASWSAPPRPKQSKILGDFYSAALVLDGPRTVADTVASIVAVKYPNARVDLRDCRSEIVQGVWLKDLNVYISAYISSGGHSMMINAEGSNSWQKFTPENMRVPYERAFEDFAQKIAAAPSDLSKVE